MSETKVEFDPGPVDEHGEYIFNQDTLARDVPLIRRIQDGYAPAYTDDGKKLLVVEGTLTEDAADALGTLWNFYYPVAIKTANRKMGVVENIPAVDVDDLVQEAYFGLYHSAIRWNTSRHKVSFLTHTRTKMNSYMNRYIDNKSTTVRVPVHMCEQIHRAKKALGSYQRDKGPSTREHIGKVLKIPLEEVEETLLAEAIGKRMGSTERGYFDDQDDMRSSWERPSRPMHPLSPETSKIGTVEEAYEARAVVQAVQEILNNPALGLDDRERTILKRRFLNLSECATQKEVGLELGVTDERVRQLEGRLLKKIRDNRASRHLRIFVLNSDQ